MKLYHRRYSDRGEALLILHGLFGNQGNWGWHAKQLSDAYSVYGLDARNHGRSPWSERMSYREMAQDVLNFMDEEGIKRCHLIGHSMGGKTAMQLSFLAPERIDKLVVVDIAPVDYPAESFPALEGLLAIEPAGLPGREEADKILSAYVEEAAVRAFLLANLQRKPEGGFGWRINLDVLARAYEEIRRAPHPLGTFNGDTLFIGGEESSYILPEHHKLILDHFPNAEIKTFSGAGHWVHSEQAEKFMQVVKVFLSKGN